MSIQLSAEPIAHVMSPVPCRILSVEQELADTYTLEIEPPGSDWGFLPGQYTMLYAFGIGEVPISISGDPADTAKIVQTIRAVGAVTDALVGLKPGDFIGVRGPFGTAWDTKAAEGSYREAMTLATGLGMHPLLAHCHVSLGMLSRLAGKPEHAMENFTIATKMWREMDTRFWLEKAEAEMKGLT